MGLLGTVFRRKQRARPDPNAIFAMATAQVELGVRHGLVPTGKAGVCFKPVSSSFFGDLEKEVKGLLAAGERTSGTRYRVVDDSYGFRWVVLADRQFEDLVTAVFLVSQSFGEHGFQDQLLASVFPFIQDGQAVHWIYSHRRNSFYPFVPMAGSGQRRDNALELSLSAKAAGELPVERELERWYALWGAPFDAVQLGGPGASNHVAEDEHGRETG